MFCFSVCRFGFCCHKIIVAFWYFVCFDFTVFKVNVI